MTRARLIMGVACAFQAFALSAVCLGAEETVVNPGLHLFITVPGPELSDADRALLREIRPGGVVLMKSNLRSVEQTRALTTAIKQAVSGGDGLGDLPLIAVDQEGGVVNRLRLPDAPSAAELGERGDAEAVCDVARRYAREGRERGIGILLAPVLDLNEGANTVIASRAFGADPVSVYALGAAFSRGVLEEGLVPCVKHYPGHGATRQDSHKMLAVLDQSGADLERTMQPFAAAARDSLPMMMVGHIAVPALDPSERPATTSAVLVRDIVRGRWRYDGLLITDDMNMGAIGTPEREAVEALRAGMDAAIYLNPAPDRIRAVHAAVAEAYRAGKLTETDWRATRARFARIQVALAGGGLSAAPAAQPAKEAPPARPRRVPPLVESGTWDSPALQ